MATRVGHRQAETAHEGATIEAPREAWSRRGGGQSSGDSRALRRAVPSRSWNPRKRLRALASLLMGPDALQWPTGSRRRLWRGLRELRPGGDRGVGSRRRCQSGGHRACPSTIPPPQPELRGWPRRSPPRRGQGKLRRGGLLRDDRAPGRGTTVELPGGGEAGPQPGWHLLVSTPDKEAYAGELVEPNEFHEHEFTPARVSFSSRELIRTRQLPRAEDLPCVLSLAHGAGG